MRVLFLIFIFFLELFATFEEGREIFNNKCATCHKEYISMNLIKENFLDKNNKLLNLKAPSANMMVWAMFDSSKKIGDANEPDFQRIEIENFLKSYLENPDRFNSICDDSALIHYDNKQSMKGELSSEDYENLTTYFFEYKENIKEPDEPNRPTISSSEEQNILNDAKKSNKKVLVYATSSSCYFCKKMDREVFLDKEVKNLIDKHYVFIKIDMDKLSLPFDLQKEYKRLTPSFFVVSHNKELISQYTGAWIKSDFINILKENIK